MKTKILIVTALLFGGLLFTSCQKDNVLLEDNATAQTLNANSTERDIEPEEYLEPRLRLTNYPEPFYSCSTIEYELSQSALIELKVCCQSGDSQYTESVLVSGMQRRGIHTAEFNSCNLPVGEFAVYLNVDNRSIRMTMHKIGVVDTACEIFLEQ